MAMEDKFYTPVLNRTIEGFIGANNEPQLVGKQATYSIVVPDYAPYATPTDIFVLIGSATKTIRITEIRISGSATAAAQLDLYVYKRTADNTAGTRASVAANICQYDSLDDAATAVPYTYSVIPTVLGAGKLIRGVIRHYFSALATATAKTEYNLSFLNNKSKSIILRGVTEALAINLGGAAVPAGLQLYINVEWVEE